MLALQTVYGLTFLPDLRLTFVTHLSKVAQIIKPKELLKIKEFETPPAEGSQVLVRVKSSGVCHSDIHLWEGGYEGVYRTHKISSVFMNYILVGSLR
jgi:Alcohol dehydrogenase GroES-like domain